MAFYERTSGQHYLEAARLNKKLISLFELIGRLDWLKSEKQNLLNLVEKHPTASCRSRDILLNQIKDLNQKKAQAVQQYLNIAKEQNFILTIADTQSRQIQTAEDKAYTPRQLQSSMDKIRKCIAKTIQICR